MGMGKHDEHTLGTGLGCLPIFRRYGQCATFEKCNRQPGPTPFSLDHGSPCKTAQRFFLPHSSVRSADDCATSNAAAAVQFPLPQTSSEVWLSHYRARSSLSSLRQIEDPPPLPSFPSFPSLSVTSFLGQSIRSNETDHFAIS